MTDLERIIAEMDADLASKHQSTSNLRFKLADYRKRLAALAGAAPVDQWQFRLLFDGKPIDGLPWSNCDQAFAEKHAHRVEVRTLYERPHAPAKAREVTEADVERAAKVIYALLPYDGRSENGSKPAWVERGNSLKQGEARQYARAALATFAEGDSE